jgi:peptidoglycan-N-acetylglucosamine deacetylase
MRTKRWLFPVACGALFGSLSAGAQQIAFTMDDLPSHSALPPWTTRVSVGQQVLRALHDAGMPPVYGFVNAVADEREPGSEQVLDLWRKAGYPLGNHTWSHLNLNAHTAEEFEAEITKNEPVLAAKMAGEDWHWLRYPFLAEGDTPEKKAAVRAWLAAHHYRIAAVTMSFGDYLWNEPYARCRTKGDDEAVAALEKSYLEAARAEAEWEQAASQKVLGRKLPFVLLMHIGAFDARMLPRLLEQYKSQGFTFVTLEQAERDAFYASDTDPSLPPEPANLAEAARAKGITLAPHPLMPGLDAVCR